MANSLSTGTGGGTQTPSTSNLQAPVGSTGVAPSNATTIQPGTAASELLNNKQGVILKNESLSTVNLGTPQASVSQFTPPPAKHTSPVLFGVSGLLFVVAIVLFVVTMRSAKNTTEE